MRRAAVALLALALGLSACGESPEDVAREDGEQVGAAVRQLFDSRSADEARAALNELESAVDGIETDTRDRVSDQVETQRGTLATATDTLSDLGQGTTVTEAGDQLKAVAQQVRAQADAFRSSNDSITNEFWRGFEDGYDDKDD